MSASLLAMCVEQTRHGLAAGHTPASSESVEATAHDRSEAKEYGLGCALALRLRGSVARIQQDAAAVAATVSDPDQPELGFLLD